MLVPLNLTNTTGMVIFVHLEKFSLLLILHYQRTLVLSKKNKTFPEREYSKFYTYISSERHCLFDFLVLNQIKFLDESLHQTSYHVENLRSINSVQMIWS